MALFARTVARLASVVAQYAQTETGQARLQTLEHARLLSAEYSRWADLLFDPEILDQLHWSNEAGRYADYGLHTDAVHLQMPARPTEPRSSPENEEEPKPIRITDKPATLKLVTSSSGYLSLFPLLLRILPPNSPRLDRILSELESDDIWTEHGLRSLSRSSPLYMKSNTKDDPPYWRGAIWINMNYLAVRSLRYYSANARTPTDVASRAQKLAVRLSRNLARTVLGELERTGYLWEQYDDNTGRGQRVHPFSGWTSLVALTVSSDAY
ncbi:Mannosyl-oligosaccharide glucosidase GCS1 [Fasciola gigantica]|uniref:mannosyl-oligosaccharide glucosidase n=1 Tax=Fasciola gigantica TaxID=46835 RepID=A0A504YCF8_FASGI|nr:Mannosyl-oligosaccharide glucosidase GCS1 [Fasciola gigantica]